MNTLSFAKKYPLSILKSFEFRVLSFDLLQTRIFLILILTCFSSVILNSQTTSVRYLTEKDTVFLSLNDNTNEKIIDHAMQQGQTLYSLARFYGLNEEQLYYYNPTLKSNKLPLGQIVHVPIPNKAIKRFKGEDFKRWKYAPIYFIVKKKDNLYKIAKTLFHMPVDSVVKWNKLPDNTIHPGQRLHVGWMSIDGVPDSLRAVKKETGQQGQTLKSQFSGNLEQRGAAFWQKNGNSNTALYCLHRSARIGSVISITNGVNNRTIYAKVIGKLPENTYGNEVILIVSPSAAKILGAVDEKFFVKIKYKI